MKVYNVMCLTIGFEVRKYVRGEGKCTVLV